MGASNVVQGKFQLQLHLGALRDTLKLLFRAQALGVGLGVLGIRCLGLGVQG